MFGGSGKRRGFVRADVPPTERTISLVLLLLIAGIGASIYVKGQYYNPALFSADQSVLSSDEPASARAQPARLVYEGDEGSVSQAEGSGSTGGLLDGLTPEGWQALGGVEHFTAETLYEKINGRAEQYLAYDVVGLTCISLVDSEGSNRFIDIFLYDMGEPVRAFGIYSIERSPGQASMALGREGYGVEASYFFWKGQHYGQIIASETGEAAEGSSLAIARELDSRLEDSGEPIWGLSALPAKGRVPGTVQYFMKDALSLDFLGNTYIARYRRGDAEVTAFLSRQPSPSEAVEAFGSYGGYLQTYGSVVDRREADGVTWVTGDMGGAFDAVFQKGRLVGGITMADDRVTAEQAASELLAQLQE